MFTIIIEDFKLYINNSNLLIKKKLFILNLLLKKNQMIKIIYLL